MDRNLEENNHSINLQDDQQDGKQRLEIDDQDRRILKFHLNTKNCVRVWFNNTQNSSVLDNLDGC